MLAITDGDRAEKIDHFNASAARWPTQSYCEVARNFDSPLLREALCVWREKAGSQPWPRREDMTPRAMKSFLSHVAIFDVIRLHGRTRYLARLTGSWFDEKVLPMTGKFLDEAIPSPHREQFQSLFDLALSVGDPIRLFASGLKFQAKDYLDVEDFLGPLGNPEGPVSAVLVVITSKPRSGITNPS